MDWIIQNKLKTGLIIALVLLNLITLSLIWMQTSESRVTAPGEQQDRRPSESANVMRSALSLTDEQSTQFTKMLSDYRERTRADNDSLVALKKRLADGLFASSFDTSAVLATAKEIGDAQARIEVSRFQYFRDFLAICTPGQQEKLRPILLELFGRRPPREEPVDGSRQARPPKQTEAKDQHEGPENDSENAVGKKAEPPPHPEPGRGGPPSVDEKLSQYSARLNLTTQQEQSVRAILQESRQKGEELRQRKNPDPGSIEEEKKKLRQEEDRQIREILDEQQKTTFKEMIEKREKNPR